MTTVTVSEALRIKNELAVKVSELQQKVAYAQCGDTYEDDILTTKKNALSVKDALPLLEKALNLSYTVNGILAEFNNATTKLANNVRLLENTKALQRIYNGILARSEPTSTVTFAIVGSARVKVTATFKPYFSKSELKSKLRELKATQRDLQNRVDVLNANKISLPFELDELEELDV